MAHTQDFYLKAQSLHEEFQKRELHYLNAERKLNSSMMWKKDINLPLQDYLARINQREKQTEETYRIIMKQMEDLDRHTDILSLKMEKLGILRNSITTVAASNWLPSTGSNLQTYIKHSLNTKANALPFNLMSVSTQTEDSMYCEKCNSAILINNQYSHFVKNLPPFSSVPLETNDKSEITYSANSQYDSCSLLNEIHNVSQYIRSEDKEQSFMHANDKSSIRKNSKTEKQTNERSPEQKLPFNMVLDENRNDSFKNGLEISNGLVAEKVQFDVSRDKEKLIESQCTVNEKIDKLQTANAESNDAFVSKSDAESMNNEFDFLESDTAKLSSKMEIQDNLGNFKSSTNQADSLDTAVSSVERHFDELNLSVKSNEQDRNALRPNSKLNASDNKSETSGSVSGFHSPNISGASDSDSIYEKGSSLTASAAYQALLGNTIIPRKTKKNVSDSESEDEVENALANVVQRNHVKSKSSVEQKKAKSTPQPDDSKPVVTASEQSFVNKPQSKLSKNTRKVLGLDTSSGSEVELAVKPAEKKIDEDSDEFDFYD